MSADPGSAMPFGAEYLLDTSLVDGIRTWAFVSPPRPAGADLINVGTAHRRRPERAATAGEPLRAASARN